MNWTFKDLATGAALDLFSGLVQITGPIMILVYVQDYPILTWFTWGWLSASVGNIYNSISNRT